jgi:predicted nucleotidyltransferase
MSTLGIIAEYNPFHNGHLYHLRKSKELSGAEFIIAVMGGHFLQRGEPALLDKWIRANMALSAGIDLVIEMPFVFASQDARGFAHGGIRLLDALGIVDYISFGCEENRIEILTELAKLIKAEPPYFKQILKEEVKKGDSFPKIRAKAISEYYQKFGLKYKSIPLNEIEETLNKPNNILALEYIRSLQKIKSSIKSVPIKRIGSKYQQDQLEGQYSSATAIRKKIIQNYFEYDPGISELLKVTMPESSYQILSDALGNEMNPIMLSCFEQAIFSQLRRMNAANIKKIHGIEEGLENRLKESVLSSHTIEHLIASIKTKRYTRTRIQRILVHSLFNLTTKEVLAFNKKGPLYCRVIGMTERGKFLLKKIKAKSKIPIVIKLKKFNQQNKINSNELIQKMIDYDILSTDLYVLGYEKGISRIGGQDYTKRIVLLNH